MMHYCKKCGRLVLKDEIDYKICDCCDSEVFPVPDEYLLSDCKLIMKKELKEQFIEEYVKTSPEFDQYLFDNREYILAEKNAKFRAHVAAGKALMEKESRGAKCPSCGSSNVSRISTVSRIISTGVLGLASSKIGKTHQCNQCGSTW